MRKNNCTECKYFIIGEWGLCCTKVLSREKCYMSGTDNIIYNKITENKNGECIYFVEYGKTFLLKMKRSLGF